MGLADGAHTGLSRNSQSEVESVERHDREGVDEDEVSSESAQKCTRPCTCLAHAYSSYIRSYYSHVQISP